MKCERRAPAALLDRQELEQALAAHRARLATPDPEKLDEAIEEQRTQLMEVLAMGKCLYEVLLYSDDDDGGMHADVVRVMNRQLDESINALDAIRMVIHRAKADATVAEQVEPQVSKPDQSASP